MNEAQKILKAELKHYQERIRILEIDKKQKDETIKEYKVKVKEILEALMVLETEIPNEESKRLVVDFGK